MLEGIVKVRLYPPKLSIMNARALPIRSNDFRKLSTLSTPRTNARPLWRMPMDILKAMAWTQRPMVAGLHAMAQSFGRLRCLPC